MDKRLIYIIGILSIGLLVGCTKSVTSLTNCPDESVASIVNCDLERGYTLTYPPWLIEQDWQEREANMTIYAHPLTHDEIAQFEEYKIAIPELENCSPDITGVPPEDMQALPAANGDASWGKVNHREIDVHGMYPFSLCKPPVLHTDGPDYWAGEAYEGAGAYALCGEHNGKTVFICISQQTANPALAEEIFSTFRWLDE